MPADGTWPSQSATSDELRSVLAGLERRLGAPGAPALSGRALTELACAVDALGQRLRRAEDDGAGRFALLAERLCELAEQQVRTSELLAAQLAESERRTQARLQAVFEELEALRPAGEPTAEPRLLRGLTLLASGAAALSVAAAGVLVTVEPQLTPPQVAAPFAALRPLPLRPGLDPVAPRAGRPEASPLSAAAPVPEAARDRYTDVAEALERGEPMALARLTGLAQAGDAAAQLHLARLSETGASGVPRDMAAARAWTQRAAEGGERTAMHNLALFLMDGEGGPRDSAGAARWFRRAAAAGVIDSQHNLGLLYEAGRGVEKNLREAYRWFTIAANAGDLASREKAVELEGRLKPAERAGLDREAAAFRPGAEAPADAAIVPPATTLAETQALLARAGYYIGPTDGAPSPALAAAAAAYMRDHPRTATP